VATTELLNPCPCCGLLTIDGPRQWEICPVCGWEDDPIQFDDPSYSGGANSICLREARENYKRIRASDPRVLDWVRPPRREECPTDATWAEDMRCRGPQINRDQIIASLEELGHRELQERLWLSTSGDVSSFEEAVCQLFDDSGLAERLAKGPAVFSEQTDALLCELSDCLLGINANRPPMDIIYDPALGRIRHLALRALARIRKG
jgi:hypothetical protein